MKSGLLSEDGDWSREPEALELAAAVDEWEGADQTRVMAKRGKVVLSLAVLGTVVVAASLVFWPRLESQPIYEGRPLQYWVTILDGFYYGAGAKAVTAGTAVEAAGTNALPFLLRWIQHESLPWQRDLARWLRPFVPSPVFQMINRPPCCRLAGGSVGAFGHLGPQAAAAVPELARLANDPGAQETAYLAITALGRIGTNSIPALVAIIDNPRHPLRATAIFALEEVGTNATQAVPHLESLMRGPDSHLAAIALTALCSISPDTYTNTAVPRR